MNIVSIDPSLISTALVISSNNEFKIFNYCKESYAKNKSGLSKWYKNAEHLIEYKYIAYREYNNYSEGELIKLKDYDLITDNIIKDILDNINPNEETKVSLEGYSFSSKNGDIIDLVTYSTLLRKKIYDRISKDIIILSPSTLKLESCKLTYQPIIKEIGGKKPRKEYKWENDLGVSGGNFTKFDMFMSIVENSNLKDKWSIHCKEIINDILTVSKIPKPYEDVNDAIILNYVIKNIYRKHI